MKFLQDLLTFAQGVMDKTSGYNTYCAAAGLFGLAVYQFSTGSYQLACQSLFGALAVAGLHSGK